MFPKIGFWTFVVPIHTGGLLCDTVHFSVYHNAKPLKGFFATNSSRLSFLTTLDPYATHSSWQVGPNMAAAQAPLESLEGS